MAEQRLIDANAVEDGFEELCRSPYFKNDVNAKHGAETLMLVCVRTDNHKPNTIVPETLPIVRQLRKELAQVMAERDTAVKDRAALAEFELSVCEQYCLGDREHGIQPCEWFRGDKCKLREWRISKNENNL